MLTGFGKVFDSSIGNNGGERGSARLQLVNRPKLDRCSQFTGASDSQLFDRRFVVELCPLWKTVERLRLFDPRANLKALEPLQEYS